MLPGSFVTVAEAYARDVVDGTQIACKWVRLACKRHLEDLKREADPEFPYRLDHAKANKACRFIELLPHTKGEWARTRPGDPTSNRIRLERWQIFILVSIFGWVSKITGLRRYRRAYVCVPRKNGKSIIASGIGLLMFAADGEYGAEVYSGATTEHQAWEVFRPAKLMAERTPELCEAAGIGVNAKNLHIVSTGSRFEPVIGKPGDGASPSCAIVDEYHEHATDDLYDTMLTGMGARAQPLMLVITTAGSNIAGPCYALQSDVQKILSGGLEDEETFGIIFTIDEGDDWTSEAALRKANPNYGVSVFEDYLRKQQKDAVQSSRKQNIFKTKHLNVWVQAREAWMNMEAWNGCADDTLDEADFLNESCWVGLDLASKLDIAARVKLFRRSLPAVTAKSEEHYEEGGEPPPKMVDHYFLFAGFYLPEDRAEEAGMSHYQGWAREELIKTTPGNVLDYSVIRADIEEDARNFQIEDIGFDPYDTKQFMLQLQEDEPHLQLTEVPQTVRHLSFAMKELEALVASKRIHHDGNPVLTWMMSNVTAKEDANENLFPRKERKENKIDGVTATLIALGRALVGEGGGSVYGEERGLVVL